ncbi:hypothetical protein J1605_004384 [Eschrichtius robustus]|uniref:Uncharacterized protein n=1 Tax=Eschrichtius robustus TaxID=9764 RepID=A0AB34HIR7_ESCRO|nr:hypothetical protein J1605_004384 [Eschrichtius robustus]
MKTNDLAAAPGDALGMASGTPQQNSQKAEENPSLLDALLRDFPAPLGPESPLPWKVRGTMLTQEEVEGELAELATDLPEFRKLPEQEEEEDGDEEEEAPVSLLDAAGLARSLFDRLWEVCSQWQKQVPVASWVPQRQWLVSVHAIRNARCRMEDHTCASQPSTCSSAYRTLWTAPTLPCSMGTEGWTPRGPESFSSPLPTLLASLPAQGLEQLRLGICAQDCALPLLQSPHPTPRTTTFRTKQRTSSLLPKNGNPSEQGSQGACAPGRIFPRADAVARWASCSEVSAVSFTRIGPKPTILLPTLQLECSFKPMSDQVSSLLQGLRQLHGS